MSTLQEIANEMVDDEIRYFEEDGMTVTLTIAQIEELKQGVLQSLCDAANNERDAINDYVRAHTKAEEV